jgi:branched-subunit amino acid aminotransferase/4-amino-4-deoxychorismate lyase
VTVAVHSSSAAAASLDAQLALPRCWVNGIPTDPRIPALSVSDRGFTLADGCFETMRAYRGVVFRLDAHLDRLAAATDRLGIPAPPHLDETVADAVRALRAGRADASVRLTVSRGVSAGVAPAPGVAPTTVLLIDRMPAFPATLGTRGLSVHIASGRRNEYAPSAGLKTLSYTDTVLALAAARARGADDAVLLDTAGHLCEGTSSNLFLVIRGVVHTPPATCGILPGITRQAVLDMLADFDIPVEQFPIPPAALDAADELFLTSCLREIAPVTRVDERPIGTGVPGPLTLRLRAAYQALVTSAIADDAGGAGGGQ